MAPHEEAGYARHDLYPYVPAQNKLKFLQQGRFKFRDLTVYVDSSVAAIARYITLRLYPFFG
jgi:hypothetical protein